MADKDSLKDKWAKASKAFNKFFYDEKLVPVEGAEKKSVEEEVKAVESSQAANSNAAGIVVEENVAKLWEIIENNNHPGFDFFEFNKLLDKKKAIRDVDKYRDVYDTAVALGNQPNMKNMLLESAQGYLDILKKEAEGFEKGFQEIVDDQVGTKKEEQSALQNDIQTLMDQKADLDKRISEKQVSLAELDDSIATKEVELNRKRMNFIVTLESVVKDINTKVEGIKTHIPDEKTTEQPS